MDNAEREEITIGHWLNKQVRNSETGLIGEVRGITINDAGETICYVSVKSNDGITFRWVSLKFLEIV